MFNIGDKYALCYFCASGTIEFVVKESDKPKVLHFSGNKCSIEFMSCDFDEESYNSNYAGMPWTSKGYNKEAFEEKTDEFYI